ncbi:MAG: helix-turn-helix domain-containing protein [Deltaproteobacteria bacterium]|nr:helix-turn-helix domain-containing protein [Deltaproteobacteria bacterium]
MRYLTITDVAQLLGRSPAAVRNLAWRRKIPYHKPAGRLLFVKDEIDRWVLESPGVSLEEVLDRGSARRS